MFRIQTLETSFNYYFRCQSVFTTTFLSVSLSRLGSFKILKNLFIRFP